MDSYGEETITCSSHTVCPAVAGAIASAKAALKAAPHFAAVSVPLAAEVAVALNRSVTPTTVNYLLDCIMGRACPSVPQTGGRAPAAFTPALQQRVVDETVYTHYGVWNDSKV